MARFTREYLLILGAHVLFFLNFSELILLSVYFAGLGYRPSRIGLFMGTFNIAVLACLPASGILSERFSRRRLFTWGALLMAVPSAMYGLQWHNDGAFLILRSLQGIGFSLAFGIVGAMVADLDGARDTRTLLGILTVAGVATHAIGPLMGEILMGTWGGQALFASSSLFGLGAFALSLLFPKGKAPAGAGGVSLRTLCLPGVASLALGTLFGSIVVFVPPFMASMNHIGSGLFFAAFVAGTMAVWAVLYRRPGMFSRRRAWRAASILMALLPMSLAVTGVSAAFFVLAVLFGVGYGYLYPVLNAYAIEEAGGRSGPANAFFVWTFNVGMFVASVLLGFVIDAAGFEAAFFATGFSCLLLLVALGAKVH